jgi:hypothetical protein
MSATPFIPFVRGQADEDLFMAHYADAPLVRVCLDRKQRLNALSSRTKLWIDVGFDGAQRAVAATEGDDWKEHLGKHGDLAFLFDAPFLQKPNRVKLEPIITAFLNEAAKFKPKYVSVPQLPIENTTYNKLNRLLAEITADWRKNQQGIQLILPVILTHQDQLNKKTARNPIIDQVAKITTKFGIDAVWSVDSTLEDQACTSTLETVRFPGVISFYEELRRACSLEMTVAGPYWGLGLVLWARGLSTHFGIGLGSTFRYHIPGGPLMAAKARVSIPSLRRWASSTPAQRDWFLLAQSKLVSGSPEQADMQNLHGQYPGLLNADIAKKQIAKTYRAWLDKIASAPAAGRALTLYQDLSAAFVTGKTLPDMPDETGLARRPEAVAKQLMMNCL